MIWYQIVLGYGLLIFNLLTFVDNFATLKVSKLGRNVCELFYIEIHKHINYMIFRIPVVHLLVILCYIYTIYIVILNANEVFIRLNRLNTMIKGWAISY